MPVPKPSRRQLLGSLLAGLWGWAFASRTPAAPAVPPPAAVAPRAPHSYDYDRATFLPGACVVYTYDAENRLLSVVEAASGMVQ